VLEEPLAMNRTTACAFARVSGTAGSILRTAAIVAIASSAVEGGTRAAENALHSSAGALDPLVKDFPEYGLTLTFPAQLTELKDGPTKSDQLKGDWRAKLNGANITVLLYVAPSAEYGFTEPEDVSDIVLANMRDPGGGDPSFGYEKTLLVPGAFGFAPYAAIGYGPVHKKDSTEITGTLFVLGGLLKENGYSLEIHTKPALSGADARVILDFFKKGIAYKGDVRVSKWTDAEAKERWTRDAPEATHKKLEPIYRTEHYIILSNSSGAKDFGKKMEECYAAIKKVYPFEEVPGRKLMPVFLFRNADEYYDYFVKVAKTTKEQAMRSKGHAWRDYYATWFEATNDPVHIHEGTHQIFKNRLRLPGGGSWFQEGVAEYMSTRPNDRNVAARLVKTKKHVPLEELVQVQSLLFSAKEDAKGGDAAGDQYKEAALFIEFLHESKWAKPKFQDAIHALGNAAANNVPSIDRAFNALYGKDIAGVEAQWIEYCKKR
jgi:hypothetical protein